MNSLIVILGSFLLLALGYVFYGRMLEKFFEVNPANIPPSKQYYDGIDYVPAKNWLMLLGHHFSSIAGAGPIVGPIIAVALWGWVPAILWVVFGSILLGGVHDFAALMISIRHKAVSISSIAETVISRRFRLIFLSFVWLTLILVVAVFISVCSQTLASDTRTVIPCFGLIFVAVITGYMLYWIKVKSFIATVVGLGLLVLCIILGNFFPIDIGKNAFLIWCAVLLVYSYIASVIPVQILLQPRDYLSSFLLYFGIIAGAIGIFITHPVINAPMFSRWDAGSAGWLWPMLFISIACGANSGFHALVASGTTAKQLPNEAYAKRIGYGAMIIEAFLAVLVILVVSAGIAPGGLQAMLAKGGPGPIGAFGKGYNEVTKTILMGKGGLIAILILNSFILTTLDTATRIGRYISQELFKINNRFFATFVVVFISGFLAVTGSWNKIWLVFGASNQLVAALTFIVIASWLLCRGKSLKFVFLPAAFMLITALAALLLQVLDGIRSKNYLIVFITMALIVLAILMVFDAIGVIRKKGLKCKIL